MANSNLATITVDVDPIWHYLNARKLSPISQTRLNAIYEDALPRFLNIFKELGITATFFVVGKDAQNTDNGKLLKKMVHEGHEIASHTMNHIQHFNEITVDEKIKEIEEADKILSSTIDKKIKGFRAPGWNITSEALKILEKNDYLYDSSILSSSLNKLMAFYFKVKNYGNIHTSIGNTRQFITSSLEPYHPNLNKIWEKGDSKILEILPSVTPKLRLPFHGAFMFFPMGVSYIHSCVAQCARRNLPLIYEFHALDAIDPGSVSDHRLNVKEGFSWLVEKKVKKIKEVIKIILKYYGKIVNLDELADKWQNN